ncbi:MAG: hypothetical protein ABEH83_06600 [Halobacterium sp.]
MSGHAEAAYDAAIEAYYRAARAGDVDDETVAVVRDAADHMRSAATEDGAPWSVASD